MELFTIGHSNLSMADFISLLHQHQITAIADVRSHPYSRYLTHFNQANCKTALVSAGIQYVFLGRELGARPEAESCYDFTGKALYERIAATELFSQGIERVLKGLAAYKIALMCAEKDPLTCHRTILIGRELQKKEQVSIYHILPDGELESHAQLEKRLLAKFNKNDLNQPIQLNLFTSPELVEIDLETAYDKQGLEIAYVKSEKPNHAPE